MQTRTEAVPTRWLKLEKKRHVAVKKEEEEEQEMLLP